MSEDFVVPEYPGARVWSSDNGVFWHGLSFFRGEVLLVSCEPSRSDAVKGLYRAASRMLPPLDEVLDVEAYMATPFGGEG